MSSRLFGYSTRLKTRKKIAFIVFYIISIFILVNLIIKFLIFPVRQISVSMIPDISENSLIMCSPLANKINRGSVVLLEPKLKLNLSKTKRISDSVVRFFTAQQFSFYEDLRFNGGSNQIRRVVALPGDTIYMRDYVLYVKAAGEKYFLTEFEIANKPYNVTFFTAPAQWDSSLGVKGSFDEIVLQENEYFVLGDNRKSSEDSRLYGVVKTENIKAKALFCFFPLNKIKVLLS